MILKELQNMIKEELDAYVGEADDDVDVSVSDADVDVDAEMGDDLEDTGAEGEDDVLRQIYDLLAAHFGGEGEEEMGDEEMPMDDVEDMGDEEADIEENSSKEAKFQKSGFAAGGKKSSGPNVGYGPGKKSHGQNAGFDAGSKALQERFQKLANIIK